MYELRMFECHIFSVCCSTTQAIQNTNETKRNWKSNEQSDNYLNIIWAFLCAIFSSKLTVIPSQFWFCSWKLNTFILQSFFFSLFSPYFVFLSLSLSFWISHSMFREFICVLLFSSNFDHFPESNFRATSGKVSLNWMLEQRPLARRENIQLVTLNTLTDQQSTPHCVNRRSNANMKKTRKKHTHVKAWMHSDLVFTFQHWPQRFYCCHLFTPLLSILSAYMLLNAVGIVVVRLAFRALYWNHLSSLSIWRVQTNHPTDQLDNDFLYIFNTAYELGIHFSSDLVALTPPQQPYIDAICIWRESRQIPCPIAYIYRYRDRF